MTIVYIAMVMFGVDWDVIFSGDRWSWKKCGKIAKLKISFNTTKQIFYRSGVYAYGLSMDLTTIVVELASRLISCLFKATAMRK